MIDRQLSVVFPTDTNMKFVYSFDQASETIHKVQKIFYVNGSRRIWLTVEY